MHATDIAAPDYFHKVVDCQWACPAHTPVPEYIRLIAAGRYSDAYMINWESNVFPGILGRTCDRPCEPACRRGRVEKEPVAICRLKRVAAEPARGAAAIHGGVAAAKHDDALADRIDVAERDVGQPVDADMDIAGSLFAAGDVELAAARRAASDEDRIEIV